MDKHRFKVPAKMTLSERLAVDRTFLANERTLLAFIRSFIVLFSSGIAILKIEALERLKVLAYIFLVAAPILLFIGIFRFYYVKRGLRKYLKEYSE